MKYPKVLLACPQSDAKDYCFDAWLDNISKFTYPNFAVYLADNSDTNKYSKKIKNMGLSCDWVKPRDKSKMKRFAESHELCRRYAMHFKFDYLFHLESDIFPHPTIIEDLLSAKKSVVGGLYHIGFGHQSELMVQLPYETDDENVLVTKKIEYELPEWLDGTVKRVYHIGLGCMLIHNSVLQHFKFRYEPNRDFHPDSFFAMDLYQKGIDIYADTSIICRHDNRPHKLMSKI